MKVQDLYTQSPLTCTPETNLAAAAGTMWEGDCGILPVVDAARKVVGVVTDRDICIALGTRNVPASQALVREVISGKVHTCRAQDDVREALRTMAARNVRRLIVVNDKGELLGVLSMHDVLMAARDPRTARGGDLLYADVVPAIDIVCRPEELRRPGSRRTPLVTT